MKKNYKYLTRIFTLGLIVSIVFMILHIINNKPIWACVFISCTLYNAVMLKIYELEEEFYKSQEEIDNTNTK